MENVIRQSSVSSSNYSSLNGKTVSAEQSSSFEVQNGDNKQSGSTRAKIIKPGLGISLAKQNGNQTLSILENGKKSQELKADKDGKFDWSKLLKHLNPEEIKAAVKQLTENLPVVDHKAAITDMQKRIKELNERIARSFDGFKDFDIASMLPTFNSGNSASGEAKKAEKVAG